MTFPVDVAENSKTRIYDFFPTARVVLIGNTIALQDVLVYMKSVCFNQ